MKKALFCIFLLILLTVYFSVNKKESENIIRFSSWGSQSETAILKSLIKEFENENNIKVEFIHIPQNYFQKIQLLFASNLEPDVIFINNQHIKMYIKANLLEDLSPYFNEKMKDFFPEAVDCFKYNNKLYAVPRDISGLVIYINKDIFKSKGINPNIELKSIEELKNLAQELTTKDYFGINTEEEPLYWLPFLAAAGAGALSDNAEKIIINDKKSIDALNLYSDFSNKYHIAPLKSEIGSITTAQMFINQKLAMYIGGRWMVPKFRETIRFNWDIIPFPADSNNKIYIDASGWAVSKNSKNKSDAVKLVQFLSSEYSYNKLAQCGLIIPAYKKSAYEYILNEKFSNPKNAKIFLTMLKNAKPTPVNENYSKINDILTEKASVMLNGNYRAEDVFNSSAVKKLEGML